MTRSSFLALAAVCASVALIPAQAQKNAPFAVVAGTVFRDPGYALADAKVTLSAAGVKPKKLQESISNYRGEFAFRVPAREAKYVLKATMKGYRPDEKEASISGEERIDVNLVLVPEAK
ncbi:MAG: carboxypeptidase-like regulatory domain-containing protein [Acidobacteriia bacterium]|nr:carboxypeptidase-like regulatory domain-containing protein [Terriglobia bacterium]